MSTERRVSEGLASRRCQLYLVWAVYDVRFAPEVGRRGKRGSSRSLQILLIDSKDIVLQGDDLYMDETRLL